MDAYRSLVGRQTPPDLASSSDRERRVARMLVGAIVSAGTGTSLAQGLTQLRQHPQVRSELMELFQLVSERVGDLHAALGIPDVPLTVHARYTRTEILAAFGVGAGVCPPTWQSGVWWEPNSQADVLAFTLDKSAGSLSPTTRYRDYSISADLIHWESQSATSLESATGRRYIAQGQGGTRVVLLARLSTADRAFWCFGPATYASHKGERPIAITWRLHHRLSGDLFAEFAAAVA